MNGKRAAQLKRYASAHVPTERAHEAYKSLKFWWSALCGNHKKLAIEAIRANKLPVGPGMSVPTPGAPPPRGKKS